MSRTLGSKAHEREHQTNRCTGCGQWRYGLVRCTACGAEPAVHIEQERRPA